MIRSNPQRRFTRSFGVRPGQHAAGQAHRAGRAAHRRIGLETLEPRLMLDGSQIITAVASDNTLAPSDPVAIAVNYNTADPQTANDNGLGLRIHYNSNDLTFQNFTNLFQTDLAGQDATPQDDTSDFDNDPTTDKFLNVLWFSFGSNWPNTALPTLLYNANFTATGGFDGTTIKFSASAVDPNRTFQSNTVTLNAEQQPTTGSISGLKYNDLDGDGVRDAGEAGLGGWTIFIDANSNGELDAGETSTVTAGNGTYSFADLEPGTYVIAEVLQEGWQQTAPATLTHTLVVNAGDALTGINFGNQAIVTTGSVAGMKFEDLNGNGVRDLGEGGLADWTIFLDANSNGALDAGEASAVTDANGNYSFAGLEPGTYVIAEVAQAGWQQTAPATLTHTVVVNAGDELTGLDFANQIIGGDTVSIGGVKYEDLNGDGVRDAGELGLAGWTIFLDANNNGVLDAGEVAVVTDADGNFLFTDLEPGLYVIAEVMQEGWEQTGPASGSHTIVLAGGQSVTDFEFANRLITAATGSISGLKFNDLDGNGVLGAGEAGLAGWTIFLDANNNGALDAGETSTVTDALGNFSFTGLEAGVYVVAEVGQAGWQQTAPTTGTHTIVLSAGQEVGDIVFANQFVSAAAGSISGTKFNDLDGDGVRDEGEAGLPGWVIFIDGNNDGILDAGELNTMTDADGNYTFTDLAPGVYVVAEVMLEGWEQTAPAAGSHLIFLNEGQAVTNVNFGNQFAAATVGSITGQKFHDLNGNGVLDEGEAGLIGWTVFLDANNNGELDAGEASVVTDADGNFAFVGLEAGTYTVAEVGQAGWEQRFPVLGTHTIVLAEGQNVTDVLFGNQFITTATGSISGQKYQDLDGDGIQDEGETGLVGWTIFIDANGNSVLDEGEVSAVTDADGNFTFTDLEAGTYIITEVGQAGWQQITPVLGNYTIIVGQGQAITDVVFGNQLIGLATGSISGVKFNDLNGNGVRDAGEPGLAGWTIFIDANNNGELDAGEVSVVTDGTGNYTFSNLTAAEYRLLEVGQAGWTQTAPVLGSFVIDLGVGEDRTAIDFGNQFVTVELGSISGVKFEDVNGNGVRDAGESVLVNWTIFLDANGNGALDAGELSTTTGINGSFTFAGLAAGTYTVAEVGQEGWTQIAPATGVHTVVLAAGANVADIDFANQQIVELGTISGVKFEDLDGDGVRDAGEPGLPGWTVYIDANNNGQLDAGEIVRITDVNGAYSFTNLAAGTYVIRELIQAGWQQTAPVAGFHSINVATGQVVENQNFANQQVQQVLQFSAGNTLDFQGTRYTVRGSGVGFVVVRPDGVDLRFEGTDKKTRVSVRGGDANIHNVQSDGPMRSLDMRDQDVDGNLVFAAAPQQLRVRNFGFGQQQLVILSDDPACTFSLIAANVYNLDINSQAVITSMRIDNWFDDDANVDVIEAPRVGQIRAASRFEADLNLTDPFARWSLQRLQADSLHTVNLTAATSVDRITAKQIVNSNILVGTDAEMGATADSSDDFRNPAAVLNRVQATGRGSIGIVDTTIVAPNIERIQAEQIQDSIIQSGGDTQRVQTKMILGSQLLVGAPVMDGLVNSSNDFFNPTATLHQFRLSGSGTNFVDTTVNAARVNDARMGTVRVNNNAAPFGLFARSIDRLSFNSPAGVTVAPGDFEQGDLHTEGDFIIRLV